MKSIFDKRCIQNVAVLRKGGMEIDSHIIVTIPA